MKKIPKNVPQGLKPVPFSSTGCSAGCKAVPFQNNESFRGVLALSEYRSLVNRRPDSEEAQSGVALLEQAHAFEASIPGFQSLFAAVLGNDER